MPSWLKKLVFACLRPLKYCVGAKDDTSDPLLSSTDLTRHAAGEFSMAVVQANQVIEDQSQVYSGPYGTFVGVYDGHGGPEASRFINDHLFKHLTKFASEQGGMSVEVLRKAFNATEEGFTSLVTQVWPKKPQIASVGSCCLVGVIYDGTLYVANLGDSRVVMGSFAKPTGAVVPLQLTMEHNAAIDAVRQELRSLHPDDSHIVVLKHGVWRVKGIIQISRSIGDVYLKKPEFNREPLLDRFRLAEPFHRPILTAEPAISVHKLQPEDRFLIFASDGLWEHLSNEEAAEIVQNNPRSGVASRLIKSALKEAAKKREMRYNDLRKIERGIRRHFHDDISVIVVFLENDLIDKGSVNRTGLSVRGGAKSNADCLHVKASESLDSYRIFSDFHAR